MQEHAIDAPVGGPQTLEIAEIADGDFRALRGEVAHLLWIAHEQPHPLSGLNQAPGHRSALSARRAVTQRHAHPSPPFVQMDAVSLLHPDLNRPAPA